MAAGGGSVGIVSRRPFLAAVVSPEAAYVISGRLGAEIEDLAARQPEWLRRQMLAALGQMREAGLQWQEGLRAEQAGERGEPVDVPVGRVLTVSDAAAVLGLRERQVRNLAGRELPGEMVKGRWVLDEAGVFACRDRRASVVVGNVS